MKSQPQPFRKRPVDIMAMLWTGGARRADDVIQWIQVNGGTARYCQVDGYERLAIDTLEGTITASPGDYLIRGVQGEFYPCKPDIFAATYDVVSAGKTPAEWEATHEVQMIRRAQAASSIMGHVLLLMVGLVVGWVTAGSVPLPW